MSALTIGGVVFACVFGGALLGTIVRNMLPDHHLSTESKDVVKLGMGLIGTMAALVLSLLISTAKSSYDTRATEVTHLAANIILLDRAMTHYGPEAKDARTLLRRHASSMIDQMWSVSRPVASPPEPAGGSEALHDAIQALSPGSDAQRSLKAQALSLSTDVARTRWLLVLQSGGSIPMPFLVVLTLWLALIFGSFGLFARPNTTVIGALFVGALSFSSAIFLILELDQPFDGLIQVFSGPMRDALVRLGR